EHHAEYPLGPLVTSSGTSAVVVLSVIEWRAKKSRSLFLCDAGGFALGEGPPGIHAPGFNFTAYAKFELIRKLADHNVLDLTDLHPDVSLIVDVVKEKLRTHFRERAARTAEQLVEEWKASKIYPYEGAPTSIVDQVERQVFDVVALNVNAYLPDFEDAN